MFTYGGVWYMDEREKRGSPESAREFCRERIIEMVKEIRDEKFLKMAYGFIKRLYGGSKQ